MSQQVGGSHPSVRSCRGWRARACARAARRPAPRGRGGRRLPRGLAHPLPAERRSAFALERFRENLLLRSVAALTFLQYGALLAVLVSGGLHFWMVGTLAFFSLCSWFFLFRWYPFLETRQTEPRAGGP